MKVCAQCGSARCDEAWVCGDCGNRPAEVDGFMAFAPLLATENSGFREEYFGELAKVEAGSFWFRARNDLIAWAMSTYFPDARRLLEIGCGSGFVLQRLREVVPSAEVSGSEILSAGLPFAARRVPSATFYQMDARKIPFRDHFDVIGAFDVLEHIGDDRAVLAQVAGALRPGGGLLLSVPQHPALWSAQDEHAHHVRRYTEHGLRQKAETAGFEVIRMTSFVSLLLPLMLVSRRRMRHQQPGQEFDVIAALRQPRAVQVALGALMTMERWLIQRGLSFPAGGSLLMICRRLGPPAIRA
jgi:SAM-dependent methyltransferase